MPHKNSNLLAQHLMWLQEEFKELPRDEIKDLFKEKGRNYQETKDALRKMRSKVKPAANKDNSISKNNASSSKIGGINPDLLKDFLRMETFSEIDVYIQQLCNNEVETIRSRKFENIKELHLEFSGTETYSVRSYWIKHLFHFHNKNLEKTAEALAVDKVLRNIIEQLYGTNYDGETSLLKKNFLLINRLVRQRNFPLDCIGELKPSQLKFELHWFSIEEARKFVKEILCRTSGPELHLVTGYGLHSKSGESKIKSMLMKIYHKRIRVCEENDGLLILTVGQDACSVEVKRSSYYRAPGRSTHYCLSI